jgi:DNA-binding response OmpR family regulator
MPEPTRASPLLLVEDDEVLSGILVRHLRARGYPTVACGSAEAALALLDRGFRPSLVLLDINLPDATGWTVARSPRLSGSGAPGVVMLSAMRVDPGRLAESGAIGYLPKPFAMETLMAVVARALQDGTA